MILDFAANPLGCAQYTVLDPDTGRCMDSDPLVYVDTDRGFYRANHVVDGVLQVDHKGRPVVKTVQRRLAIFTRLDHLQDNP